MQDSDPKSETDVDILLRALHRADQNWPNRGDLERYWEGHRYFRSFGSIEEAETAISNFHERESTESRIWDIGWHLREKALEAFLDAHVSKTDSFERGTAQRIIDQLMSTSSFNGLEMFLRDVVENGAEKAIKKYRTVDRGANYGHIFAGFLALVEVAVLLLVLSACQHGFQTIVICALGFIYSVIAFQGLSSNDFNVRRFATVVGETSRVRYLLKDKGFKRNEAEEDFVQLNKSLAKSHVRFWIACVKFCIIDLICLVCMVMSAV